jgi:hypothetical protein
VSGAVLSSSDPLTRPTLIPESGTTKLRILGIRTLDRVPYATHGHGLHTSRALRRPSLQRIFSTFPSGRPGIGLLLLRAALSATLCAQGAEYLSEWRDLAFLIAALAVVLIVMAGFLFAGFLTPIASVLAALASLSNALPLTSSSNSSLFATTIAAALFFLGPGAFSLDARLFGRQEIVVSDSQ